MHASNSSQGIEDVEAGDADIGLSGNFKEDDPEATTSHYFVDLTDHVLVVVPFALIVSPDIQNSVRNLTGQQLIEIYNGAVTNWRQIDGPDEPITVVNRTAGSATRNTFELFVTRSKPRLGVGVDEDTTAQVITLVANSTGSIGYAATTNLIAQKTGNGPVAYPICIDGVAPTRSAITGGTYQFWNFEHAYTKTQLAPAEQGIVDDFLRYICNDTFKQQILVGSGFLTIDELRSNVLAARLSAVGQKLQPCMPNTSQHPDLL